MGRPLSFVESLVAPVLDWRCPVVWQTIDALLWGNKQTLDTVEPQKYYQARAAKKF